MFDLVFQVRVVKFIFFAGRCIVGGIDGVQHQPNTRVRVGQTLQNVRIVLHQAGPAVLGIGKFHVLIQRPAVLK